MTSGIHVRAIVKKKQRNIKGLDNSLDFLLPFFPQIYKIKRIHNKLRILLLRANTFREKLGLFTWLIYGEWRKLLWRKDEIQISGQDSVIFWEIKQNLLEVQIRKLICTIWFWTKLTQKNILVKKSLILKLDQFFFHLYIENFWYSQISIINFQLLLILTWNKSKIILVNYHANNLEIDRLYYYFNCWRVNWIIKSIKSLNHDVTNFLHSINTRYLKTAKNRRL